MRIVVTGGMGFIGTEVVETLLELKQEVVIVDFWNDLIRQYERARHPILGKVYRNLTLAADVLEPSKYLQELYEVAPDVIVHLGAVVDTTDMASDEMIDRNVRYTRDLVRAANGSRLAADIPGIVFASSAAVYGSDFRSPSNPYGLTKVLGEKTVVQTRGQFACLRFFNVFGAMEHHKEDMASVPFKIAQAYRTGNRFDLHSPESSRDFVPVSSVTEAVSEIALKMDLNRRSLEKNQIRQIFDVGTGKSTTFLDLDNFIMQATGNSNSVIRIINRPSHLTGRYQEYTCAGRSLPALGNGNSTRYGIEEQYGNGKITI